MLGYNGHIINQADVVLLQYPLRYQMNESVAMNDILYYQNVTQANGMFTGDASYSISWLRLNQYKQALAYWDLSFAHLNPPFNVWNERIVGGTPHFITGGGGFLQNVIFGFGGIYLNENNITINPLYLPPGVDYIKFRSMYYLGIPLSVAIDFQEKLITFCIENALVHNTKRALRSSCLAIIDNQGQTYTLSSQPISVTLVFTEI